MPYFQITIEVAGLKCLLEGGDRVAGFCTHRRGRGADESEAFAGARVRLLAERKVAGLIELSRKNGGGDPQVSLEEAHEIPFWKYVITRNQSGLAMYPEDEQNNEPTA